LVFGFALMGARLASYAARAGGTVATKTPVSRVIPKTAGWGGIGKTAIVGGSVAAGGLGISSAIGTAQQSFERGGGGLIMVGGFALVGLIIVFMLMRGKK